MKTDAARIAQVREWQAKPENRPKVVAAKARYRRTVRGKLVNCRARANYLLRRETRAERVEQLNRLIAQYDRELARLGRKEGAA